MSYVLVKYVHMAAIMILFAALIIEHIQLKAVMTPKELRRMAIVDAIYGSSAVVTLVAGLSLWFLVGKGAAFYSTNPVFHTKLTLFAIVALLSIYPTLFFIKHRNTKEPEIKMPKSIVMLIRVELLLVLIIPLLGVLMAQGYGL